MNRLQKIKELELDFQSHLPLTKEVEKKLNHKIRLEFNYNSNHIEGNTLTYGETELLLIKGQVSGDHEKRELDEMEAHDLAFSTIKEWAADKTRKLTEVDIKNLNRIILVRPFWKEALTSEGIPTRKKIIPGNYKTTPNSVLLSNGEVFDYASPDETSILMRELVEWYWKEEEKQELHAIEIAALFHYRFVRIHPFDDGNGRIARLILNYILLKDDLPPIIIKTEDKKNYLRALNKADVGDIEAFKDYIYNQLEWSLNLFIKAAKGLEIEESDDWKKELELLKKKGEDAPLKRTEKVTLERLEDSIFPLLNAILESSENFIAPLFSSYNYHLSSLNQDLIPNLKKEFEKIQIETNKKQDVKFAITFKDYKKNGTKTFDTQIEYLITFLDFKYSIQIKNRTDSNLTKPIDEPLRMSEIDDLVNKFGKIVTDLIKKNTD